MAPSNRFREGTPPVDPIVLRRSRERLLAEAVSGVATHPMRKRATTLRWRLAAVGVLVVVAATGLRVVNRREERRDGQ